MPADITFEATVEEIRPRRLAVRLPFDPSQEWGDKDRYYVSGEVGGRRIRGRLERQQDQTLLPLGPAWVRDNGISAGNRVTVRLAAEGPQQDSVAPDIAVALAGEPEALRFFESLATFYRRGYVNWIESAKRPETRARRIAEAVALLKAGIRQR